MKRYLFLLLLGVILCGCAPQSPPAEPPVTEPAPTVPPTTIPPTEPATESLFFQILEPQAPGISQIRTEDAVVDHSNTADGYVMVKCKDPGTRLKVLLQGPNTTYNYNITPDKWTVLPLSDGSGRYRLGLYRDTGGSRYALVLSGEFEGVLTDEFAPFLRPNQYVDYGSAPETVALGATLCHGLTKPLDKVAAVYDYVVDNFSYDTELASSVQSGYLPVLDRVLEAKKGICFDYAALVTAMLRSQEIPCKLVVGYAGTAYHAWISVWTEEDGWVDGVIFFDGHIWKRMDPTFASSAEDRAEILDFIENGSYTAKYIY